MLESIEDLTEKIKETYNFLKEDNWDPLRELNFNDSRKSAFQAERYFQMAKDCLTDQPYDEYRYLTMSLSFAIPGSPDELRVYTHRSAYLYSRGKYDWCLLDVNRSMQHPYCLPQIYDELSSRKNYLIYKIEEDRNERIALKVGPDFSFLKTTMFERSILICSVLA